jgi:formamidopyrimidine-DNA glycosylase
MPELPEVETTIRGLTPLLLRQKIARVTLRRLDLRCPFPEDLGQRLTGASVTAREIWRDFYRPWRPYDFPLGHVRALAN